MIPKCVEDLWRQLELRGRKTNVDALLRLVKYWAVRSPMSISDVCEYYSEKLRIGFPMRMLWYRQSVDATTKSAQPK